MYIACGNLSVDWQEPQNTTQYPMCICKYRGVWGRVAVRGPFLSWGTPDLWGRSALGKALQHVLSTTLWACRWGLICFAVGVYERCAGVGAVCCCVSRNIGKSLNRFDHQTLLRRDISQSWGGTVNKSLTSSSFTEPRHVPTVTCGYAISNLVYKNSK